MDDFILTLVASDTPLSAAHMAIIERFMGESAIMITQPPQWLKEHKAADFMLDTKPTIDHIKSLRRLFAEDKIDIFVTPAATREKKLLVADMDSTIVDGETLDELADFAGIKDKIAAITERAMRGELDFHDALRERVGLLKGLPEDSLQKTLERTAFNKGAQTFIKTLRDNGVTCVLVSGGFTFFTEYFASAAGFNAHHGNILHIEDGKLTGTVGEPILDKESKVAYLTKYTQELGLDTTQTMAIGDGANDLPMLQTAGQGFGYHGKPLIKDQIENCIIHGDLTAVLYALGYSDF